MLQKLQLKFTLMLLQLCDSRFAKEYLNQLSSPSKYSAFVSFCYSYQYLQLWIQTPLCPALLKQNGLWYL